uniref:Uncharacterized protein n=1 Tax=Arundo donax TaxID=35708 RepID=A0A0A9C6K4_ARUDO
MPQTKHEQWHGRGWPTETMGGLARPSAAKANACGAPSREPPNRECRGHRGPEGDRLGPKQPHNVHRALVADLSTGTLVAACRSHESPT